MSQDSWIPILTLVLGWLLSEGSNALRRRGNRKEAVRLALTELLELRHRLIINQFIFSELNKKIELPPLALYQLRKSLPSPLQRDPTISARLNQALTEVAKHDPFLAFRLRGKDIVNMVETLFHPKLVEEDQFAAFARETEKGLYDEILPEFDQVIINTARYAGIAEWFRAVLLIRVRPRVGKDVLESTDRFMTSFAEQVKNHAKNS